MPTISMFFGILIRMYYDEHNPPHFHALYQGSQATFDMDGNILQVKQLLIWMAISFRAISPIDRRNWFPHGLYCIKMNY